MKHFYVHTNHHNLYFPIDKEKAILESGMAVSYLTSSYISNFCITYCLEESELFSEFEDNTCTIARIIVLHFNS